MSEPRFKQVRTCTLCGRQYKSRDGAITHAIEYHGLKLKGINAPGDDEMAPEFEKPDLITLKKPVDEDK